MFIVTEQCNTDTYIVVDIYDNVEEVVSKQYLGKLRKTSVFNEFCGLTARAIKPMIDKPVQAAKYYMQNDKRVALNAIMQKGRGYYCNSVPENIALLYIDGRKTPRDESELNTASCRNKHSVGFKIAAKDAELLEYLQIPWGMEVLHYTDLARTIRLRTLELPTSMKVLGTNCLRDCASLLSIFIPRNVFAIEPDAFSGTVSLENIEVATDNAWYKSIEGILYNKQGTMLMYCPPKCKDTVVVPKGVTTLGKCAFKHFKGKSIVLPDTLRYIEPNAFTGSVCLKDLKLPDSVKEIDGWCFRECISLSSIRIPSSVYRLGNYAFYQCSNLKKIIIEGMNTSIHSRTFHGIPDECEIYCLKDSCVDKYKDKFSKHGENILSRLKVVTSLNNILR